MSFTSTIKAQKGKRVGFPGNPICKTRRKPLKNGVKKVTFLQLDEGARKISGRKTQIKHRCSQQ
jgi:hypothetical protein